MCPASLLFSFTTKTRLSEVLTGHRPTQVNTTLRNLVDKTFPHQIATRRLGMAKKIANMLLHTVEESCVASKEILAFGQEVRKVTAFKLGRIHVPNDEATRGDHVVPNATLQKTTHMLSPLIPE